MSYVERRFAETLTDLLGGPARLGVVIDQTTLAHGFIQRRADSEQVDPK
jgi:hypothetical protein